MSRVVFLHPDLGIGGAERAMIDAALALKSRGHSVKFVTAHHDPGHCFQETRDGTFSVTAVGDWLPRSMCGICYAAWAYIRMIYAAIYLVFFSKMKYDVVICDQISVCIPVLRIGNTRIIFYCHFPDQLLTQRKSFLKKLYRWPIDWMEEKTTGMADVVLVNSNFTAGLFKDTFTALDHIKPDVLYPIPDFQAFRKPIAPPTVDLMPKGTDKTIFLSINRYERKKNLALAIRSLAKLGRLLGSMEGIHLVMAGGYDERVTENIEYYQELVQLATDLNVLEHITFIRSFNDSQKRTLLAYSSCLLYTPDKEHFGIVPIEAMYMQCPVIAVKSGGPLETVSHKQTGFLCDPNPLSFAEAMKEIVKNPSFAKKLGEAGKNRVETMFSFNAFSEQLNRVVSNLIEDKKEN
ncbi:alpha-1,3/1,6-mannosyltransferase ALG2-like [Lineus longissimus]|uniref:alpha-1,3/1,6-mannosyltransferase ALG2-like n=1 Tax=Lineus longissimus TaxID=88925 RepID=UPI002B4E2575